MRAERKEAVEVQAELGIRYTHALRLTRLAREKDPSLTGVALRDACWKLLERRDN